MRVESLISEASFSMREIYVLVVPHFSANCSCVIPFSFLSSCNMIPSLKDSNSSSNFSLAVVPRLPYCSFKWSVKDVRFLLFIEVLNLQIQLKYFGVNMTIWSSPLIYVIILMIFFCRPKWFCRN